eukprot:GSMAST32.ASY1.ANO1.1297.1 assembled CDS
MQCMWYELEKGEAHLRLKQYGQALKQFHKHFKDICEDQFDFHTYCLRKMTLRPYVRLLRFTDELHSHRFFIRGACGAIKAYMALHMKPKNLSKMTSSERKRWKKEIQNIQKMNEKNNNDETNKSKEKTKISSGNKKNKKSESVDDDPLGEKLAATKTPLEDASKFVIAMEKFGRQKVSFFFN